MYSSIFTTCHRTQYIFLKKWLNSIKNIFLRTYLVTKNVNYKCFWMLQNVFKLVGAKFEVFFIYGFKVIEDLSIVPYGYFSVQNSKKWGNCVSNRNLLFRWCSINRRWHNCYLWNDCLVIWRWSICYLHSQQHNYINRLIANYDTLFIFSTFLKTKVKRSDNTLIIVIKLHQI